MSKQTRLRGEPNNKQISVSWFVICLVFIAVVGFVAGSNKHQIYSVVAPIFGVKTYSGTLDFSSVQRTYQELKANFDGDLDDQILIEGASKGLVDAAGDQYTVYMNSKEVEDFSNGLSGNIGGGIGIEVGKKDGQVYVVRVLKDNPAEKAGLVAGDNIVKINGQSTVGWDIDDAVSKIRGESGTTVKLSIARSGEFLDFNITRAIVNNPSAYDSGIKDGIGVITVTRFDSDTGRLVRSIARDFVDKKVKGVILDLRGNGGGYLSAAQEVAGVWLDNKIVVVEKTRGKVVEELKSGTSTVLGNVPTVVLVNSSTASASEIVAGALMDYKVATIIGESTFGKGSVQELIKLPQGAQLKVTIARWYTPAGQDISEKGIDPDVKVELNIKDVEAGRDPQMEAAKRKLQ